MPKGTSSSNGPGGGSSSKQYRRFRLLFSSKMWFHQSTYSEHLTSVSAFGRLWWSESINAPAKDETSPGHLLSGMARNRQWGLIPCAPQFPRQVAAECPCATLHEDVRSGRVRYPCLTTPAPTNEGRSMPAKRKRTESPETMRRWNQGGRQEPPWQYRKSALVTIQGKLDIPDPKTREFLYMACRKTTPGLQVPDHAAGCLETRGTCRRADFCSSQSSYQTKPCKLQQCQPTSGTCQCLKRGTIQMGRVLFSAPAVGGFVRACSGIPTSLREMSWPGL